MRQNRRAAALVLGIAAMLLAACAGPSGSPRPAGQSVGDPSPGAVPRPSHVVVVVEENHSSASIIGASDAPFINSLADGGALFTDSTAVAHPSQPNYVALFSGSTQGLTDDSCPHTFSADNLGSQLAAAGHSFAAYSEDLPKQGDLTCSSGDYRRKHNPWTDFSSVPASANQPLTAFPQNFDALPAVSFVIPNLAHDMHNGTVLEGDSWLRDHLSAYAAWAKDHNSLLIVTWDEDDNQSGNHITTIFTGASVNPGRYSEPITHYRVLRTLETAFGLAPLGQAADVAPITDVWASGGSQGATGSPSP